MNDLLAYFIAETHWIALCSADLSGPHCSASAIVHRQFVTNSAITYAAPGADFRSTSNKTRSQYDLTAEINFVVVIQFNEGLGKQPPSLLPY